VLTEDWRSDKEIKTRIAMAKESFNKKRRLLCSKMDLHLRKRLVISYVWSVLLYGSETWKLRKQDKNRLEAFEMWVWRRMEKIKWTDKIKNEVVLERVGERRKLLQAVQKRKSNWLGHVLRRQCLQRDMLEGSVEGRLKRGRLRRKIIDDMKQEKNYQELKFMAEDRRGWRHHWSKGPA